MPTLAETPPTQVETASVLDAELPGPASKGGLPFDPVTVALGVWQRRYILLAGVILSAVAAVLGARRFGSSVFEAETILLYRPKVVVGQLDTSKDSAPLITFMNLVKIITNIEKTRDILKLPVMARALEKAATVEVERRTDLMRIGIRWDSAEMAASIANTLRDVFLESQREMRRSQLDEEIHGIESRLATVQQALAESDRRLGDFTAKNKIVDLSQEVRGYLEHFNSVDLLLDQARIEKKTIDLQAENLDRIIKELRDRASKEKSELAATEALSNVNLRIQRLRESIIDDRDFRANSALLAQKEAELDRMRTMRAGGLASDLQLRVAEAAYEKQKALTLDTDQIKDWKAQMDKLDTTIIPSETATPAGRLADEMVLRAFNIRLDRVSLVEKVKYLEEARERASLKLEALPKLEREFVRLTRVVTAHENEKKTLEDSLGNLRRLYESDITDFAIVSPAKPSAYPLRSNRKMIAAALGGMGVMGTLLAVLALVLLDTRVKSKRDLEIKSRSPILGAIPLLQSPEDACPREGATCVPDPYRLLARELRSKVRGEGRRIVLLASGRGEGVSTILANLAFTFGRKGESVLVIDADMSRPGDPVLSTLPIEKGDGLRGLADLLVSGGDELQGFVHRSWMPGVHVLSRGLAEVPRDVLDSREVAAVLAEAGRKYSLTLIEAPPLEVSVDSESLAASCDSVLYVARSCVTKASTVKAGIARLDKAGASVAGAVLNGVDALFSRFGG